MKVSNMKQMAKDKQHKQYTGIVSFNKQEALWFLQVHQIPTTKRCNITVEPSAIVLKREKITRGDASV
jgi:hypothetical protein